MFTIQSQPLEGKHTRKPGCHVCESDDLGDGDQRLRSENGPYEVVKQLGRKDRPHEQVVAEDRRHESVDAELVDPLQGENVDRPPQGL